MLIRAGVGTEQLPRVAGDPTTVRVVTGTEEIARHARSYDTGDIIEQAAHVGGLIDAGPPPPVVATP